MDEQSAFVESPYYKLQLIPDLPPDIAAVDIPQYQRINLFDPMVQELSFVVSDDYGITDALMVATVAQGSGEAIQFREITISFDQQAGGTRQVFTRKLKLDSMGLIPGSELYFHVQATDNRTPVAQTTRTPTYFIILEDTVQAQLTVAGSLGVDLMPDYFRSQLQIIIDSKQLLEDRPKISRHEFNSRSNALGYDQKQLRLKYGQFIGEEEDSGLEIDPTEPETAADPDATADPDVLGEYGHDHDHENEEGQVLDKGTWQVDEHQHDHPEHEEEEHDDDPLTQYLHDHDNEESATFLFQSVKTKLRAALNEMWDAELYLRLYDPAQSLPYQHAALKLLNEIKNHARIYVQRVGFDPPPIKESESRLSRTNDTPNTRPFGYERRDSLDFPGIRDLVRAIGQHNFVPDSSNRLIPQLREAGNELAVLAVDAPGPYLEELRIIQILIARPVFTVADQDILLQLRKELIKLIPVSSEIQQPAVAQGPLNETYLRILEQTQTP